MYRNVEIIIYDYDELIEKIKICNKNNFLFAYALHDKDKNENGELKKPHYHLRIFYENKKTLSAWSKILQCQEHDIEILKDKRLSIRYLIHLDNKEKYQYDPDIIVSNFSLENYLTLKKEESDDIIIIIDYIKNHQKIKYYELMKFIVKNELWSTYRRNYSIIKDIIIEHNTYNLNLY